jgi:hypothetical protein
MPARPTPVIGYTIEFTVATNKVVHATDNNNRPNKFTSSPTLAEDELVELCREVVEKAAAAFQNTQRTFELQIDERGQIFRDRSFPLSLPAGFALAGPSAEAAGPRGTSAVKPKTRKPKNVRAKPKPAATKPKRKPISRKAKKAES